MIGSPTGPCEPRSISPSPRYSTIGLDGPFSPNLTVSSASGQGGAQLRSPNSPQKYHWHDTSALPSSQKGFDSQWKREARLCVHADTNNNVVVYPNYVFDPDGEIVAAPQQGTFDLASFIAKEADGINYAGQATGLLIAAYPKRNGGTKLRLGSLFQVSPTRAIACLRTTRGDERSKPELWMSKVCFIQHWEAMFNDPTCRDKFFRRTNIVHGFEEMREHMCSMYADRAAVNGMTPPLTADFVVLELPEEFVDDPFLKPLPKNKFKTIKKVGVVAYNQKDPRDEASRGEVYTCTQGVPLYDAEHKFIHTGNKSLSPGILVGFTDSYITYENSLLDGAVGGPLISLTRPHYFWGMQCCAFSDLEMSNQSKSRNYNCALSFYHPVVIALYSEFVLGTLPYADAEAVRAECF